MVRRLVQADRHIGDGIARQKELIAELARGANRASARSDRASLAGDDAEPIMFDLMQPLLARGCGGFGG